MADKVLKIINYAALQRVKTEPQGSWRGQSSKWRIMIERLARETHHAFRGIEFPEAARFRCLKFRCLGASRGPGTGSPAVDDDPEIRNARLAARCITLSITAISPETFLFLIAVAAVQIRLSIWFLSPFCAPFSAMVAPAVPEYAVSSFPVYVSPRSPLIGTDICFAIGFMRKMTSTPLSMRVQRRYRTCEN